MSIEARSPPPQFAFRLKRTLGGRAGWSGFALQIVFVLILVWIGYEIFTNARTNLENQRIASGFGFLNNNAGFDVSDRHAVGAHPFFPFALIVSFAVRTH